MAAHAILKNEFTEDKKCQNLMSWLIRILSPCSTLARRLCAVCARQKKKSVTEENVSDCKSKNNVSLEKSLKADKTIYEPAHEIMALFVLRKRILQTHMRS